MKTIVLISCVAKKRDEPSPAKDLYISPLFKNSLAYAYSLKPDKIFILSALHHLLELDKVIEPYNVTLSNIPKSKRKEGLIVLNSEEKKEWGKWVIDQLSAQADLKNDKFIILAGQEYIKPIRPYIKTLDDILKGLNMFERVPFLKNQIQ